MPPHGSVLAEGTCALGVLGEVMLSVLGYPGAAGDNDTAEPAVLAVSCHPGHPLPTPAL